ncbi:STM4014 family protein [Thermomonospora umbrina]|uniref:Glutathione synthase/RimK-type ligase-like ATP-grasp enzyme n=1 Tax=Thermomonospora umbrina TaxID=111806 RepID=A0A3D9SHS0_9ACTN|nr:STM4014 family protein [Thermomonospora umbrina]REE95442.1 glutathione synthase/RimK-type ligase-like ATP-grasp enzyme [Thermomonospora umbrina]
MTFTVVGTPGDRRVTLFAAACEASGLPPPDVLAWRDVLSDVPPSFRPGTLLRIDSPGEDAACDALLRGPGDPARVGGGARWYATFTAALSRIAAGARRDGAVMVNDPDEIAVMFDKRRCHARLSAAGVPVPPALGGAVHDYAHLRERLSEARWSRVFVKPAHGSSGSGVVALQFAGRRIKAVTSAVPAPDGGYRNSLRVRSYETEPEVAALIDALATDGLHVERWVPKAALDGRVLDLRVVVIDGVPTHAVVRTSRHPMTNLHLGGLRGDLTAVRAALGETGWRRALAVCADAARRFPGSPMVGVDLLVGLDWHGLSVAEVNAFGDLLPNLPGLPGTAAEGLDTYTAQVRAALSRTAAPCAHGSRRGFGCAQGAADVSGGGGGV